MTLLTERLELCALDAAQLRRLTEALPALERELDCRYRAEPLEGHFLEILRGQLAPTEADPENYPFHSFWLLIRREDRVVVGSADFKTPPDENGETELGYGLGAAFEHRGYMTEAVRAMCAFAVARPGVRRVVAETEPENEASARVLLRCGFTEEEGRGGLRRFAFPAARGRE